MMAKKYAEIDEIGRKNPFKVPEGYMEGLTEQIMEKLSNVEKEQAPASKPWDRIKPLIYMAAMFAGIALIFKLFSGDFNRSGNLIVFNQNKQSQPNILKDATDEELYDFWEYDAVRNGYREDVYIGEK